jgi:hypothetical protein
VPKRYPIPKRDSLHAPEGIIDRSPIFNEDRVRTSLLTLKESRTRIYVRVEFHSVQIILCKDVKQGTALLEAWSGSNIQIALEKAQRANQSLRFNQGLIPRYCLATDEPASFIQPPYIWDLLTGFAHRIPNPNPHEIESTDIIEDLRTFCSKANKDTKIQDELLRLQESYLDAVDSAYLASLDIPGLDFKYLKSKIQTKYKELTIQLIHVPHERVAPEPLMIPAPINKPSISLINAARQMKLRANRKMESAQIRQMIETAIQHKK